MCSIIKFEFLFTGVNVATIHWEMSVDTEEFDSRNDYLMHVSPFLDTRKWRWCNEDALYDISCGDTEIDIVSDFIVKNDIANGVYDIEDVNEMD